MNELYGLILTMVANFTINQTIQVYVKKLKLFKTILLWLIPVPSQGTSQLKLYSELGLQSLKFRRWFIELRLLFKTKKLVYQNI